MLVIALVFWALAMICATLGFAIVTGGAAVIAQALFWLFFGHSLLLFVAGWGYVGLMNSAGEQQANMNP